DRRGLRLLPAHTAGRVSVARHGRHAAAARRHVRFRRIRTRSRVRRMACARAYALSIPEKKQIMHKKESFSLRFAGRGSLFSENAHFTFPALLTPLPRPA